MAATECFSGDCGLCLTCKNNTENSFKNIHLLKRNIRIFVSLITLNTKFETLTFYILKSKNNNL